MVTNVDAVTVFNGRTDATRRKAFLPTVIRGVSYVEGKGSRVADNGVWSGDVQYKLRIPLDAVVQDGRGYVRDLDYVKLDDGEAAKHWTLQKGDLAICGEYAGGKLLLYEDEIAMYAKENGLDLIHVTEYADSTSGGSRYLRHWRMGGK